MHSSKADELEDQMSKLKHDVTRASLVSRPDTSSKIIGELESRLFEGERERGALRNERDALVQKQEILEREVKIKNINEEMFQMIKSNHVLLEKNNEALLKQLDTINESQQEQQLIWETEINDLTHTIEILKRQLRKNEIS